MKDLYEKCICNLIYGGISKQEYQELEEEIREKNRSSLNTASVCLTLMFTALFLGSLFAEMMAPNRMVYGVVWLCFLVIFVLCQLMKKRGKAFIIPLWYLAQAFRPKRCIAAVLSMNCRKAFL
ncbi:MAG: hypothetical protein ACI4AB_04655 [Acetatifactor sp.]